MAAVLAGILAWPAVAMWSASPVVITDTVPQSVATTAEPGPWSNIGHRGLTGSREATENTLHAFRLARDGGATAIEFDVQVTADGQVIVMHDDSLARTTTCEGSVSELTWTDIQTRCRGKLANERIPSLDDALAWVGHHGLSALVELKPPARNLTPVVLSGIIARIHEAGLSGRVLVFSRGLSLLRQVETLDPTIRTQYIAATYADAVRSMRLVDGLNICAEVLYDHPGFARQLIARDKLVVGRVTDSRADWATLVNQGVHGTLTNNPAELTSWYDGNPQPSRAAPDGECRAVGEIGSDAP